ncbi:MAG: S46 family peptidase [candidate division Zixibacteria bacterium]|nr:S46 family peptidase [candidate division Zixibacteria bacterium]
MYRKLILSLLITTWCAVVCSNISADDGLWPLYDLDRLPLDSLRAAGLELTPEEIFNPGQGALADAVVQLGGGSSSFVSPDGLIITNHHVAFGAVQKQSTVERNYIRDGFYAAARSEEVPAIGYKVRVTLAVEDVTERVLAAVNGRADGLKRQEAIEEISKQIIAEAEDGRDVRCKLAEMLGGMQYILYTYFEIRDVRIVYAPPEAIGGYGGDIDNWMWPRHAGDFSFVRAYVARDGSSAEYSEENVPYQSNRWLPFSTAGVKAGDLTMMIGFPGKTHRHACSFYIKDILNRRVPGHIRMAENIIAINDSAGALDSEVAIRLASRNSSLNNYLKKNYGFRVGLKRLNVLDKKQQSDKQLSEFINSCPELTNRYGPVLKQLDSLYREKALTGDKDYVLEWLVWASDMMEWACDLHKWAIEREKPDSDREPGFQERDVRLTQEKLRNLQINLVPAVDRTVLKYLLVRALELPEGQKIDAIEQIVEGTSGEERERRLDDYLEAMYEKTAMDEIEARLKMFEMSASEIEQLDDPMIRLAVALRPVLDEVSQREKTFEGALNRISPYYIRAMAELSQKPLYPDANSTMRINFGAIAGFSPRDAVTYRYQTGLRGVMEKETGEDPFTVPDELKQVFEAGDFGDYVDPIINDVPVNFCASNSGTNGNSGSPVVNGRGELIGLDFDTDFEGVSADYMYDPQLSRAIVVDVRYVLFLVDKVYHLDELLGELTIH